MVRFTPVLTIALLIGPVIAGLAGIILPAFGYLPALGRTSLSFAPFSDLLEMPGLWRSAQISLWTGLASAALTCVITFLFLAGWSHTRAFGWMRRVLSPLLSVPHAAAALGLAFLISPSGWLMRLVSPWATGLDRPPDLLIVHDPAGLAMIAALVAKEVPFLLLMALAALPQTDATRRSQVAASFGYGRMAGFAYAVLPKLYRQLRLPIFAIIAFSTSTVDVALVLGPTLPAPLAVRVVDWLNDPDLARRFVASAGALLQIGVTGAALLAWLGLEKTIATIGRQAVLSGVRFRNDRGVRLAGAGFALLCAMTIGLGLAGLAVWSVAGFWRFPDALPPSLTLDTWRSHWGAATDLFRTTFAIAAIATLVATLLTLGCLENESRHGRTPSSRVLGLVFVPLLVPQVSLLFGLQVLFLSAGLPPTLPTVALAHLVFVLPYVFLALSDLWRALDPRYAQIAAALGSDSGRTFRHVRLPMMLPAILTAAAVGFAVSVGQYLPTLMIGAGRVATVTTEAVALSAGGNRQLVGVYAVLQMVLPLLAFAVALLVPAVLFRHRTGLRAVRP